MIEDRNDKNSEETDHHEVFSKAVRAGKRTYFFDVKETRRNNFFLTITESKKRFHKDGRFFFEKHKIFLYQEDFEKFAEGYREVLEYVKTLKVPENLADDFNGNENSAEDYTNVDFDDLESIGLEEGKLKN